MGGGDSILTKILLSEVTRKENADEAKFNMAQLHMSLNLCVASHYNNSFVMHSDLVGSQLNTGLI